VPLLCIPLRDPMSLRQRQATSEGNRDGQKKAYHPVGILGSALSGPASASMSNWVWRLADAAVLLLLVLLVLLLLSRYWCCCRGFALSSEALSVQYRNRLRGVCNEVGSTSLEARLVCER